MIKPKSKMKKLSIISSGYSDGQVKLKNNKEMNLQILKMFFFDRGN
jgi:hypothetical protein